VYAEKRIRETKSKLKNCRHLLKGGPLDRLSKSRSREVKSEIRYLEDLIDEYQRLLLILHHVGDAIAFTYIDKWDIKPLAFRAAPGFISGKKGSALERRILREIFRRGGIAILNDLTTCLRHGDITIPLEAGGRFHALEVKSGGWANARCNRQLQDLTNVMDYIRTDQTKTLYGRSGEFVRVSSLTPEVYHLGWLNKLVQRATKSGEAVRQVERGLYYYATYVSGISGLKRALRACKEPCIGFVNAFKSSNTAYYPFTLSFKEPEALFDFYAGELSIVVVADMSVLSEYLSNLRYELKPINDENSAFECVGTNGESFSVSTHFWNRVFVEFLSMRWIASDLPERWWRAGIQSPRPLAPTTSHK
jgi:hypothetical protein